MSQNAFICVECGTQFRESADPPPNCPICQDERQYVPAHGQRWTTLRDLLPHFEVLIREADERLYRIYVRPKFAIGQQAYLIQAPEGNILWDCITQVDTGTVSAIWAHGGISAIAISHPHYYSSMIEWSRAFGGVPIYLHVEDRSWVQRDDKVIEYWGGDTKDLQPGVTLIRCGGHFAGGTVLHWAQGSGGKGVLLPGDVMQVCPDRKHFSFMYSYPNFIPLNAAAVRRIVNALEPFPFEQAFGAFGSVIESGASLALRRSAERYLRAIS